MFISHQPVSLTQIFIQLNISTENRVVLETVHCCVQCELGIDLPNVDMISTRHLYYDMTMSRHGNTFSITGPLPVRGMHWWLVYSPHKGPVPVYSPHKVTIILVAFMIVASALIKVS